MRSDAATVEEYLASLPPDRREALQEVRSTILDNLPVGYEETMGWGMIAYVVPLERYPDTYNGQPLMYAALASQKRHMALYLTGVYSHEASRQRFLEGYRASGKQPDVGKSCVRFTRLDDLPLDVVGEAIGEYEVDDFVRLQEEARSRR
jgi:hypothetical protein